MLADHKTRVSELLAQAKDKKQAADALGELAQLAAKAELESVLVTALPQVIEAIGDKQKTTQAAATQVRRGEGLGPLERRVWRMERVTRGMAGSDATGGGLLEKQRRAGSAAGVAAARCSRRSCLACRRGARCTCCRA